VAKKKATSLHVFGPKTRRLLRKERPAVFLAADSTFFIRLIKKELKDSGYELRSAVDGASALAMVLENPPDILLLSGTLPDMTGAEALVQIRANVETHYLPVILMSVRDHVADITAGLEAGADDYIAKPFDGRLLRARIDNQLRIRSLRNELEQSNLYLRDLGRVKDELLALCSHDLKIPMKTILWYTQMLRDGLITDPDKMHLAFSNIEDHGRRIFSYIDDVLDLAKLGSGPGIRPEPAIPSKILEEARALVAGPATQRSVSITLEVEDPAGQTISGEESLLVRLFQNLIANAIFHGPEGGRVRVVGRPIGDMMQIQITDEGEGIPEDQLESIFTAFPKTTPFGTGGAGVGLAICREIVERHYGTITLKRQQGFGAVFEIYLPIDPQREE
jgi:signal transduction histidine kinase